MSAAEIIAMIDQLSPTEREKVKLHLEASSGAKPAGEGVRRAGVAEGLAVGEKFIDRHPELFRRLAQ
ncbi:MAG: hypothetical protein JNK23_11735 [Opitutaceae bacterium]|nr:hypothetical protein [Opitutaceae bacterium]